LKPDCWTAGGNGSQPDAETSPARRYILLGIKLSISIVLMVLLFASIDAGSLSADSAAHGSASIQMNTDPSTYDVLGRRFYLRANLKF